MGQITFGLISNQNHLHVMFKNKNKGKMFENEICQKTRIANKDIR